ncbi:TetR/AcrR family transcriptional regulator [Pseudodonghicola flavimaris]|uniref:TetR/AcrR family transcriptional regulator n=1 Tax=Pseudodonghicola flavimaris TaxID=3050036 RepID=A0ABT7F1Z9_9RHOB|nr:TetR/AcrR family transcriptional regulator [Pseudodonghicola flavimaris]MDK3018632.1 TetR/AcrR family transcriptional regulator [Pseudodonghicola flavimaris]
MTGAQGRKRDRKATEALIMKAVGTVLTREGFPGLTLKAVAAEAGVDKVLIYRYYGPIDALLTAYGQSVEFWPTVADVVPPEPEAISPAARLAYFLDRTTEELSRRPLTLELLAMEVGAPNPLTEALDTVREAWGRDVAQHLLGGSDPDPQLNVAISLVLAGIQNLLVRGRTTGIYSGMDIGSAEGWREIRASLPWLCERLLPSRPDPNPSTED